MASRSCVELHYGNGCEVEVCRLLSVNGVGLRILCGISMFKFPLY